MKRLDLTQKKQINGAKGSGFWGGAIGGSLIAQTALDVLKFVFDLVDGSKPEDEHRTVSGYRPYRAYGSYGSYGNFLATHAIVQVSKYPSQTRMRLGIPWE